MGEFLILFTLMGIINAQIWEYYYEQQARDNGSVTTCGYSEDVTLSYRKANYHFGLYTFRKLAVESNVHFAFSPLAVWQSLAAVAEGTEGIARQELFDILGLPEDECIRKRYYELAATRLHSGPDIKLERNNILVLDENSKINHKWKDFALTQCQLDTTLAPIRRKPKDAAYMIRNAISTQLSSLNFQGNSVLLSSMDYNGLWTEAFSDAGIYRAPFYNSEGQPIGSVDMMRTFRRVRMTIVEKINSKLLELPVGEDGRLRMIILMPADGKVVKSLGPVDGDLAIAAFNSFRESLIPIDIRIPRFVIESEWDVRKVLDYIGIHNLWTDAVATRNISEPGALPSSFIQRVSIRLDKQGMRQDFNELTTNHKDYSSEDSGLDPILGREFIVDRPFTFGLFDADTLTCIMASAFTLPTFK